MAKNIIVPAVASPHELERPNPSGGRIMAPPPSPFPWVNERRKRQVDSYNDLLGSTNAFLNTLATHFLAIDRVRNIGREIEYAHENLEYKIDLIKEQREQIAARRRPAKSATTATTPSDTIEEGILEEDDD